MNEKLLLVTIAAMLIIVSFSGCTEEQQSGIEHVDADLNTLGLTSDDILGYLIKTDEDYTSEPHVMDVVSSPLYGEIILENYSILFENPDSEYYSIALMLMRFESSAKAKNAIDLLKSALESDYPEQSMSVIGEKSYLGKNTVTKLGTDIDSYLLLFSIGDVLVFLAGTEDLQANFVGYGKILENNIMEVCE
jgi:hypothetical protein